MAKAAEITAGCTLKCGLKFVGFNEAQGRGYLINQDIANKRPSDLQRPIHPNGLFHVPFFKLYLDAQHPLMFTIYI